VTTHEPPAPGWWQAPDGGWHPPTEQRPAALPSDWTPAGNPVPEPQPRWRPIAVLIGAVAAVGLAVLVFSGDDEDDTASSGATTALAVTSSVAVSPRDQYVASIAEDGTESVAAQPFEVESVAANNCDNDVAGFVTLFGLLETIYSGSELELAILDKRNLVEAFCRDRLLQFDTALSDAGYDVPQ
jgi:hypothetical protein